jgi:hypothetical protein
MNFLLVIITLSAYMAMAEAPVARNPGAPSELLDAQAGERVFVFE